jgi:hypothetical protein
MGEIGRQGLRQHEERGRGKGMREEKRRTGRTWEPLVLRPSLE